MLRKIGIGKMRKVRKNEEDIDNKPKTHIKGEIGVVLGILILGFVTITLIIRLFGMIFYDWHERGNYFLMHTHINVFKFLPGEQESDVCTREFLCEHIEYDYSRIDMGNISITGKTDGIIRCILLGFPTKYRNNEVVVANEKANEEAIIMTVNSNGEYEFWDDYTKGEQDLLITKYESVLIKVSIIESVIILLRLIINYILIRLLLKLYRHFKKEDRLGIQPKF